MNVSLLVARGAVLLLLFLPWNIVRAVCGFRAAGYSPRVFMASLRYAWRLHALRMERLDRLRHPERWGGR